VFGNGISESRGYDPVGRLVSQFVGSVDTRAYGFDVMGNMTSKQTSAETDQFTYDSLNRLTGEGRVLGSMIHSNGFGYDPNGNRLSEVRDGTTSTLSYTPDSNRLVQIGSGPLTLDAAGNTIADTAGSRGFYYGQRAACSGSVKTVCPSPHIFTMASVNGRARSRPRGFRSTTMTCSGAYSARPR
jgi:hypothetical protein